RTAEDADHERRSDGDPRDCERLCPNCGSSKISQCRQSDRSHCAGSLDHPGDDQLKNVLGKSTTDAAQAEQRQPDNQYRLASPAITGPAQRNLENTLRKSIDSEGNSGEADTRSGVANGVDAKDRQHEEDTQQSQC